LMRDPGVIDGHTGGADLEDFRDVVGVDGDAANAAGAGIEIDEAVEADRVLAVVEAGEVEVGVGERDWKA